jgi:Fic family protein
MLALGFPTKEESILQSLTLDVLKSSEIEGEILNYDQVRSSIAIRLGLEAGGLKPVDRNVEGIVDMILDATQQYTKFLTDERLFGWHAALFPTGHSGMYKIEVAQYRSGIMQVVSGAIGHEKVHFQAIPPVQLPTEMARFISWFNGPDGLDPVLKAAIAHFWFIIIHPFDDGNGRIARALTDLLLARSENSPDRFYSMSSQIMAEKKSYYAILQEVQYSSGDITAWIVWFLSCLKHALLSADQQLDAVLWKVEFWKKHQRLVFNHRQRLMLTKLMHDFQGKLQSSKWAKMTHCSHDTALRDLNDLMDKGILRKELSGGRNTTYALIP